MLLRLLLVIGYNAAQAVNSGRHSRFCIVCGRFQQFSAAPLVLCHKGGVLPVAANRALIQTGSTGSCFYCRARQQRRQGLLLSRCNLSHPLSAGRVCGRLWAVSGDFLPFHLFQALRDTLCNAAASLPPCLIAGSMPGAVFKFPVMPAP